MNASEVTFAVVTDKPKHSELWVVNPSRNRALRLEVGRLLKPVSPRQPTYVLYAYDHADYFVYQDYKQLLDKKPSTVHGTASDSGKFSILKPYLLANLEKFANRRVIYFPIESKDLDMLPGNQIPNPRAKEQLLKDYPYKALKLLCQATGTTLEELPEPLRKHAVLHGI